MRTRGEVLVYEDSAAAARAGAERFVAAARAAVEARGRFTVALSGGETPRGMYALLAVEPYVSAIPWDAVRVCWGDDRAVPPRHPRSNFRMAWETFLSRVPIPAENVHRIRGELPARDAASEYARDLVALFEGPPRFDLIHLGLGDDAHTASLFPFSPALSERRALVCATRQPGTMEPRVTFTFPMLNAARTPEFLVTGRRKATVVQHVLQGALDPLHYPAQGVRPAGLPAVWLLDTAAAGELTPR
jgi:6-phosphogluconolactonase